jgi:DNA-binding NarL/FixJ family response regulator
MTGGTLLVSRAVKLHAAHKKRLENLGFKNVSVTSAEKDGLNYVINELKPKLVIIGSGFYKCATPYMMSILHKRFKDLNIAAVSIYDYPADIAMKFIVNGISSYINYCDGSDFFYEGLDNVRQGEKYVSPSVQERMEIRRELPPPSYELTERQVEVLRFLCNGFTSLEIAEKLSVSRRTVEFHKAELFNSLCTRNENELIRIALFLGVIKVDELDFYGQEFELSPKPRKCSEK